MWSFAEEMLKKEDEEDADTDETAAGITFEDTILQVQELN
eukprot:COSAG05_NODE_159_length_15652_cov_14.134636_12_plen_40_part_00